MRIRAVVLRPLVLVAAAAASCAPQGNARPSQRPGPEPTIVLDRPSVPPDQFNNREGRDLGPLHNVLRVTDRLYSGNSPESDAAFAELQALGVKTIISVDGGRPLIDRAEAYGMRYVHIPVGYDGIDGQTQVLIARAYRDLPGPVYLHCHHGRHRGPTAAASAAVILGEMTPEQGVALLKAAKTSPNYPGLYECVSSISPEFRDFVDRAPPADSLPSVATVSGLVANMVGIDFCFENLGHVKKANWTVPKDHPDLVPAAEAGRLADHYRVLMDDPECGNISAEFVALLKRSWEEAQALEDAIVAKKGAERLDALFAAVDQSCRDCHNSYRNVKRKK